MLLLLQSFYGLLDFVWDYLGELVPERQNQSRFTVARGNELQWHLLGHMQIWHDPREITMPAPQHHILGKYLQIPSLPITILLSPASIQSNFLQSNPKHKTHSVIRTIKTIRQYCQAMQWTQRWQFSANAVYLWSRYVKGTNVWFVHKKTANCVQLVCQNTF